VGPRLDSLPELLNSGLSWTVLLEDVGPLVALRRSGAHLGGGEDIDHVRHEIASGSGRLIVKPSTSWVEFREEPQIPRVENFGSIRAALIVSAISRPIGLLLASTTARFARGGQGTVRK